MLLSFPGLGVQRAPGGRAEIEDDHTRFANARSLKAYTGSSPITRALARSRASPASGSRTTASPTPTTSGRSLRSPTHLERRPTTGAAATNTETGAQPPSATSSNRMTGQLYPCVQERELSGQQTAFHRTRCRSLTRQRREVSTRTASIPGEFQGPSGVPVADDGQVCRLPAQLPTPLRRPHPYKGPVRAKGSVPGGRHQRGYA
ncbi:hypothetical protein [Streptomyces sp. bgisy034]|uniref:hypothetical protein n=1 Tax=Streptomyces sp. bgisy034 TaxID=3413774 RepID=UPI003EBA7E41